MAFNETIAELAMAAYGRALAKSGMDHYDNLLITNTLTEEDIRNEFMSNAEAAVRFPSSQSNQDTVKQIFNNILGRDPATQEGLDHYSNLLATGSWTQSDLVGQVLIDARGASGADRDYLDLQVSIARTSYDFTVSDEQILASINDGLGTLSSYSTEGVSSLLSGYYWDTSLDFITFGFNTYIPSSYYEYGTELTSGWLPLNEQQKDAVRDVATELNKLIGVSLEESTTNPMIQFNVVDMHSSISGFAFYPGNYNVYDGDIFLSSSFNTNTEYLGLEAGQNGYSTIAHELGHALGLEHTFEGFSTLPLETDDKNHSVMSYTVRDSYVPEFTVNRSAISMTTSSVMPDLYSIYDIAALQTIYGANTTTNTENNIYTISYSDYDIKTIWDAGGEDTIDLSNTSGVTAIDLRGGTINSADQYSLQEIIAISEADVNDARFNSWIEEEITELYNNGELYTGENNLSIANGVIIENLKTGSGSDIVIDNEVNNNIFTFGGNDKIYLGNGGYDYIDGGGGNDALYIDLFSTQAQVSRSSSGDYILMADSFGVNFIGIEYIVFNDKTIYTSDILIA